MKKTTLLSLAGTLLLLANSCSQKDKMAVQPAAQTVVSNSTTAPQEGDVLDVPRDSTTAASRATAGTGLCIFPDLYANGRYITGAANGWSVIAGQNIGYKWDAVLIQNCPTYGALDILLVQDIPTSTGSTNSVVRQVFEENWSVNTSVLKVSRLSSGLSAGTGYRIIYRDRSSGLSGYGPAFTIYDAQSTPNEETASAAFVIAPNGACYYCGSASPYQSTTVTVSWNTSRFAATDQLDVYVSGDQYDTTLPSAYRNLGTWKLVGTATNSTGSLTFPLKSANFNYNTSSNTTIPYSSRFRVRVQKQGSNLSSGGSSLDNFVTEP